MLKHRAVETPTTRGLRALHCPLENLLPSGVPHSLPPWMGYPQRCCKQHRGGWEGCHGNGFKATEPAGNICAQPCAHHVLLASRLSLLICQAEVSLLIFGLQGPRCLLPSGRMCWEAVTKASVTENKHFPAGIESLSIPKSSRGQGIFV